LEFLLKFDCSFFGSYWGWLAKGVDFFGEVNAHGAPGDTSPTPDTAGCAELIDPGGQFMREPHAIAVFGRRPEIFPVNIAMIGCEAGIPNPGVLGLLKV
jgi:hypothetical protein